MNTKLILVARILLGLIFAVFGINKFVGFMPAPDFSGSASTFMQGLGASGYLFPLLGVIETISGIFLLTNKFPRLAVLMLLPVTTNILLFHLFMAPAGGAPGYLAFILNAFLIAAYKQDLECILK